MKVWIVVFSDCTEYVAVFSTEEAAKEYVLLVNNRSIRKVTVFSDDVR